MSKLLESLTEKTESYIKELVHFVQNIKDLCLEPGEMLVSYDEVSLFTTVSFLLYIHKITDHIGRIMKKHDIRIMYKPRRKIHEHLNSSEDKKDPIKSSGVYRISCSDNQVYIRNTNHSIITRIDEHKRHCHFLQYENLLWLN